MYAMDIHVDGIIFRDPVWDPSKNGKFHYLEDKNIHVSETLCVLNLCL